jgi:Tol biopolymer transport system component
MAIETREAAPSLVSPQSNSPASADAACGIKELKRAEAGGVIVHSPDRTRYLLNKEDAKGVAQIYIANAGTSELRCLSCTQRPGSPRPDRYKLQPTWHPSGRWFIVGVERDKYSPPPILRWSRKYVEGQLRNGLWTNMYAVSPDGERWVRLTDFDDRPAGTPNGFTGPAFTPDGKRAVWSQIVDGNILVYTFGRWELILADFDETNGPPRLVNRKNITPTGMHWNEPGNFHPDNRTLLLTGSVEKDAQGMDQYLLDIATHKLTNLTKSATVWDEHGRLSPNGEKIIFMSAYPYRDDPKASKVLSIRTEFMLMNADGSGVTQLTRFRTRGFPEYSDKGGIAANPVWNPDGRSAHLRRLFFPEYEDWTISFRGSCGGGAP